MVKKWLAVAACALVPASIAAEPSLAEVMKQLEALQRQVQQQQVVIEQLQGQLTRQPAATASQDAQVRDVVKQEIEKAIEEKKLPEDSDAPYVSLGSNIDGITLKGDLRLRYEYRDRDDQDKGNRDRFRTRFRIGGVWENSEENWEIGAGLATGGDDPTSTNDTWSEDTFFETGDIRLDYAYAKHTTEWKGTDLVLTLGQQKNPFLGGWLLYDTDVRPAGFTFHASRCGFFTTLGYYDVFNGGDEIVEMWGAQVGYEYDGDRLGGKIAGAYYGYNDSTFKDGAASGAWGYPGPSANDFDIQIADLYAEVSMPLGEVAKVKLLAEYFVNLGASGAAGQGYFLDPSLDPESEDDGWLAGAELKLGRTSFAYYYAGMSEDAANPMLVDSDFSTGLGGVDMEAHRFKASYKITKNASLSILAQFAEAMERSDVGDVDLYQVDLQYKF